MKKIGFLIILLFLGLLTTWCGNINSKMDEIRILELSQTKQGRVELCNDKIISDIDSGAINLVWEELLFDDQWDELSRISQYMVYFTANDWTEKIYTCTLTEHWKSVELYEIDQNLFRWWEWITLVAETCEEEWWKIEERYEWWEKQNVCFYPDESFCYLEDLAIEKCHKWDMKYYDEEIENDFELDTDDVEDHVANYNDIQEWEYNGIQYENILVVESENMNIDHVINLKIWDKTFDVILEENSATKALIEKLHEWDVIVNAREYWWFEKVWNLWFDLPREDKQITTNPWDIVLYQWNQISLFYESNSWSYTPIWTIQNISQSELKEILWDDDVDLVFSL